jgi:HEAT repeat protein
MLDSRTLATERSGQQRHEMLRLFGPNVEALARKGDLRRLAALVAHDDPAIVERAKTALAGMPVETISEGIRPLAWSEASEVLGVLPDARQVDVLLALLAAAGPLSHPGFVQRLGHLKDARAVEPLAALLDQSGVSRVVRLSILEALREIGDSGAVPALRRAVGGDDPTRHLMELDVLAHCGDELALEQLITIARDPNAGRAPGPNGRPDEHAARDRTHAAQQLRRIGGPRVADALVELFDGAWAKAGLDGAYDLYREVAEALGELGDRRAVGPLLEWVDSMEKYSVPSDRPHPAIDALGQLGDARAVPVLARLLADQRVSRYWFTRRLRSRGSIDHASERSEQHTHRALAAIKAAVRGTDIEAEWVPETEGARTGWPEYVQWPEWGCCVPGCGDKLISTLDPDTGVMYCSQHADQVPPWKP